MIYPNKRLTLTLVTWLHICGYHIMLPLTFKRSFNMLLIVYYHTEETKLSDNVITRYNVDMDFME